MKKITMKKAMATTMVLLMSLAAPMSLMAASYEEQLEAYEAAKAEALVEYEANKAEKEAEYEEEKAAALEAYEAAKAEALAEYEAERAAYEAGKAEAEAEYEAEKAAALAEFEAEKAGAEKQDKIDKAKEILDFAKEEAHRLIDEFGEFKQEEKDRYADEYAQYLVDKAKADKKQETIQTAVEFAQYLKDTALDTKTQYETYLAEKADALAKYEAEKAEKEADHYAGYNSVLDGIAEGPTSDLIDLENTFVDVQGGPGSWGVDFIVPNSGTVENVGGYPVDLVTKGGEKEWDLVFKEPGVFTFYAHANNGNGNSFQLITVVVTADDVNKPFALGNSNGMNQFAVGSFLKEVEEFKYDDFTYDKFAPDVKCFEKGEFESKYQDFEFEPGKFSFTPKEFLSAFPEFAYGPFEYEGFSFKDYDGTFNYDDFFFKLFDYGKFIYDDFVFVPGDNGTVIITTGGDDDGGYYNEGGFTETTTTVIETITTDIIDGPVALGEITLPKDEEYIIVEDGVPLGNLPKTGTAANIGAGAAGMIMTISALAGAGATLLKKEDA